jgi:hypothetical protein
MLDASAENTDALTVALNSRMTIDKRFAAMFPAHMDAYAKN